MVRRQYARENLSDPPPLLSLRSAVIFTLGLLYGVTVGVLTFLGSGDVIAAVLAGLGTTGPAIAFFDRVIASSP